MSLLISAAILSEGTVDGEPVVFEYDPRQRDIVYTPRDRTQHIISGKSIICVLQHSIIHVIHDPDTEGIPISEVSRLAVTGLPPAVFADYAPSQDIATFRRIAHATHDKQMLTTRIIVSVASGTWQAQKFYETLLSRLLEYLDLGANTDYAVHFTTSEHTVTEITRDVLLPAANLGLPQRVIMLSGDGGMVDIANAIVSSERTPQFRNPSVTILPLGTGNALAHSIHATADDTMGLSTMVRGTSRKLPILRATFSPGAKVLVNQATEEQDLHHVDGKPTIWGCVVGSWGFHATLVADSDTVEYRKHGAQRFQMAAKEALHPEFSIGPHRYRGRVSVLKDADGVPIWTKVPREEHAYVLATYVANLEKTFTISPASAPLDGRLRLIHFGPLPGDDIMAIMTAAYGGGKHVEDERVGYEDVEGVRIDFDEPDARWRRVCVDGKIIRVEAGGWVEFTKEPDEVLEVMCLAQR